MPGPRSLSSSTHTATLDRSHCHALVMVRLVLGFLQFDAGVLVLLSLQMKKNTNIPYQSSYMELLGISVMVIMPHQQEHLHSCVLGGSSWSC